MRRSIFSFQVAWLAAFLLVVSASTVSASPPKWGDVIGPVTATSLGVRIPSTTAELATMTPADEARIRNVVMPRLPEIEALVAKGALQLHGETAFAATTRSSLSGRFASRMAAPIINAQCGIWWTDYPGSGTAIRGGGWTRTDTPAYNVVHGNFYQDGTWLGNFAAALSNSTNAESYTSWFWRAWWDPTHNYFTESYHSVEQGGIYYLGPDAYCSYSVSK